jgi:formylmethanofuran dehydrogenase subunit B
LRAGGNRSGADAVSTWQTGYPTAINFARGYPQYRPHETAATLRGGGFDAALVIGSMSSLLPDVRGALDRLPGALIGPRASLERGAGSRIAIDTGIAGIHEAGTAIRMDDVPLPLRVSVSGPPAAYMVVAELRSRIHGLLHR